MKKLVFLSMLLLVMLGCSDGSKDYSLETLEVVQKAAEKGNPHAQFELGKRYFDGDGVDKNFREAARWFIKSAEKTKDEAAQFNAGLCYSRVDNYDDAIKWFRLAAAQGNAGAQYMLGFCYYYGEGVEEDEDEAVRWYMMAAEQGDEDAIKKLRSMGEW